MSILTLPPTFYEFAFNAPPNQDAIPPFWQDLSPRVQFAWQASRGRQVELDANETGTWSPALANPDGALDPANAASPFAPNLLLYRGCRIRCQPGPNLLTPDQAGAGQASPYPVGPVPGQLGVGNEYGYQVSLAASAGAFTGSQVYQVTLPNGATQFTTVVSLPRVPVVPGQQYSFTAQTLITAGNSVGTNCAILWYGAGGTALGSVGGAAVTITSGSSSWTALTVSGQAPAGAGPALYAELKVEVAQAGALTAATAYQVGALQWEASATPTPWQAPNTVSRNLFPQAVATGSQSMNPAADSVANWWWASGPAGQGLAQASYLTPPPSGQSTALAWTTPSGTTNSSVLYAGNYLGLNTLMPQPDNVQVTAASTYTASWYASRAASADTTVQVTPHIKWFNLAGAVVGTTDGTAVTVPLAPAWAQATVTGAAPAGAAWGRASMNITSPAGTTAANTIYATGWQFEQAASATSWVDPGPVYFIFTGSYERMPQTWTEDDGTYGTAEPVGVDAFAGLSQPILLEPFVNEVLALGPNFFYQLNDTAGASQVVDTAGRRPSAPIENSPFGAGSLTLGASVSSTSPAGGVQGTSGTVAAFANTPTSASQHEAVTFISLHKTSTVPGPPSTGSFTRILTFNCASAPPTSTSGNLWTAYPPTWAGANQSSWWFQLTSVFGTPGSVNMNCAGPNGAGYAYLGTTNYCDGNWHMLAMTYSPTATAGYIDGATAFSAGSGPNPSGIATDVIGCSVQTGTQYFCQGLDASVGHVIEFPSALTAAQIQNLYNSWRNASTGDSSGQRYQRILSWVGYTGPTSIQTGSTQAMGPATDTNGAGALDALNNVALTENGDHYAATNGTLTFKGRADRYNKRVPSFTFGEGAPVGTAGEWPCEISQIEYDASLLANRLQVTQYSTNTVSYANDAASAQNYYSRTYQRTVNTASSSEPQDAANYLLSQYKDPHQRVDVIHLHPSAVPGLMNACLQLEKGTRIRAVRRPNGAPSIAVDAFVEKLDWSWDPDSGDVTLDVQASPANLVSYWTLAALHTTLNAQATSGTNTAAINALPDSALNTLAQSLPSSGYQLTFEPGTPRAETMTIAPGGIPSTGIGWSTATLTFTANFAFTHAAGAVACEALPTAYTDPTMWDLGSVLGAASTTLAFGFASGTTAITLGPLPDAKTNPFGADYTAGDKLMFTGTAGTFGTYVTEAVNLLTLDQASAGMGTPLAVGTASNAVGMNTGYATMSVAASASAFFGTQVWQESIGASAASGNPLFNLFKVPAPPLMAFTFSVYVRSLTTGANPQVTLFIEWLNASSAGFASNTGTGVTLTGSPTAAWTRVTLTATAPAGTVWANPQLRLTGTTPTSAWTFQADALQFEQSTSPGTFSAPLQISSVAASVPGYTAVGVNLAFGTVVGHAAGEIVSDVLPPGVTSPAAIAATTRVAY